MREDQLHLLLFFLSFFLLRFSFLFDLGCHQERARHVPIKVDDAGKVAADDRPRRPHHVVPHRHRRVLLLPQVKRALKYAQEEEEEARKKKKK
jgi:hypothetical protein